VSYQPEQVHIAYGGKNNILFSVYGTRTHSLCFGTSSYFLIGELQANVTKEKLFLVNVFFLSIKFWMLQPLAISNVF